MFLENHHLQYINLSFNLMMNMEKKLCGIVLLLLFLLTHELMIQTEARNCYSRSKRYHGRCYFRNQVGNCKAICKQESFTTGRCVRGTCFCARQCGSPGGGHHPSHPPPSGGDDGGAGGGEGGGEGGEGGGAQSLKH